MVFVASMIKDPDRALGLPLLAPTTTMPTYKEWPFFENVKWFGAYPPPSRDEPTQADLERRAKREAKRAARAELDCINKTPVAERPKKCLPARARAAHGGVLHHMQITDEEIQMVFENGSPSSTNSS
jgi:hypothetical protein